MSAIRKHMLDFLVHRALQMSEEDLIAAFGIHPEDLRRFLRDISFLTDTTNPVTQQYLSAYTRQFLVRRIERLSNEKIVQLYITLNGS